MASACSTDAVSILPEHECRRPRAAPCSAGLSCTPHSRECESSSPSPPPLAIPAPIPAPRLLRRGLGWGDAPPEREERRLSSRRLSSSIIGSPGGADREGEERRGVLPADRSAALPRTKSSRLTPSPSPRLLLLWRGGVMDV